MAGKGGGAWKVAYADFVTAMMAFFLVMWITAQNTKIKEAIAHYFNQADEPPKRPVRRPRDESDEPPKHLLQPVTPTLTTDPEDPELRVPRVLTIRESDRSSIGTIVYFEEGSTTLDEAAIDRLNRLLAWIVGKPHKIEVRGHGPDAAAVAGSSTPSPGAADPWELSYARCVAVKQFLETHGIPSDRLRLSQAGAHEPLTLQKEPSRQSRNARVEVYVLNEHTQDYVGTRAERAQEEETQ